MKNSKKASLLLLSCLLFVGVNLLFSPKAEAVVTSQKQIEEGLTTLEFKNRSTIVGKFGGDTINFIDRNPYDTGNGDYNYVPDEGFFCSTGDSVKGITIQNGAIAPGNFGKVASSVPASVDLDYNPLGTTADQGCKGEKALSAGVRTNGVAFSSFEWSGASLKEISSGENFKQLSSSVKEFYVTDKSDGCYGNSVVVLSNDNQGVLYKLIKSSDVSKGRDASKDDVLKKYFTKSNECWVASTFPTSVIGDRTKNLENAKTIAEAEGQTASCESSFSYGFEYILCPALKIADNLAGTFTNFIEDQLYFCTGASSTIAGAKCPDDSSVNNLTDQVKKAWSIFRVIASVSLVIIMLVMVLSEAIGFGLFDAYTIRKLLPKLIIAVILIQISWVMFKWFIDLSNDLGVGIKDLMYAPFGGSDNIALDKLVGNEIKTATGDNANEFALFSAIGLVTAAWVSLPGIFTLAFFAVFALLTAFVTLVFRKLLIITLVILSPLALACWILPGTERYWKMWLTNFQKILLMFPLIMGLIAGGRIFAHITGTGGSTGAGAGSFAELAIIIVAFFGPLFFLPKTFAWGGEFMKMGSGAIKGGVDKIKAKPMEYAKNRGENWRDERRKISKERYAKNEGFGRNPIKWAPVVGDKFRSGEWDPLYGRKGSRRRENIKTGYKAGGASAEEEETKNAKLSNEIEYSQMAESDREEYVREKAKGTVMKVKDGKIVKDAEGNFQRDRDATVMERRAALEKLAVLGGERNLKLIQEEHDKIMQEGIQPGASKEALEAERMIGKFKDANAQTLFKKLPHLYKNYDYDQEFVGVDIHGNPKRNPNFHDVSRTINGLNPEDVTALSGVGTSTLIEQAQLRIPELQATATARITAAQNAINEAHLRGAPATEIDGLVNKLANEQNAVSAAQGDLARLVEVYSQAVQDENLRGHIGSETNKAMLGLINSGGAAGLGVDTEIRTILQKVSGSGVVRASGTVVPQSPAEIKIQHNDSYQLNVPSPAAIPGGGTSPNRDAYKARLISDPATVEALAHGLAYSIAPADRPAQLAVLAEMQNEIVNPAGGGTPSPDAVAAYNRIIDQIQQAYTQRVRDTANAVQARGRDPATAITAAQNRLNPEIADVESLRIRAI